MTFLGLRSGFTRRTFLLRTYRPRGGVILYDRDDRPGVKFKDADLVGFPLRISIGEKSLAKGEVEIKPRNGALIPVKIAEAVSRVLHLVSTQARPT